MCLFYNELEDGEHSLVYDGILAESEFCIGYNLNLHDFDELRDDPLVLADVIVFARGGAGWVGRKRWVKYHIFDYRRIVIRRRVFYFES